MSINNREDANNYYKLINGLVDDYIDNHKIRPSKLSSYLKPGGQRFNKFLERNKLKDVNYNKESQDITSIPALHFNQATRSFTLKIVDTKRVSTLKSLTPKRITEKNKES